MYEKEEWIDQIVALEWKQFQAVQNEGGRAACQDDWETFQIMRKRQFMARDMDVLISYAQDLVLAETSQWNLLTEKYGRMMASTAPEDYAAIAERLPKRSEARLALQEKIIETLVSWEEAFAASYPHISGKSRPIHTAEDTPWETSAETYARGELGTYSDATVEAYYNMCKRKKEAGENLMTEISQNIMAFYGYHSLEEAEASLK